MQNLKNPSNQHNIKKIKYKLKKEQNIIKEINFEKFNHKVNINCSYNFLIKKFGKPCYLSNENLIFKTIWIITVKTSNLFDYSILIYNEKELINDELKNNVDWSIAGCDDYEYIDWIKLVKLFKFEFSNYLKQQDKLEKINNKDNNKKNNMIKTNELLKSINNEHNKNIQFDKKRFIDIDKYKKLDNEKLKEFTNDDLASVLFTRFKESDNFLFKEALIIYRALQEPENYNKSSSNNVICSKNKLKYNNKKDKSKYNNKKN